MTASARPVDRIQWFRRFHDAPRPAVRLLCLPHAGGSAPFFRPLSAALPAHVEALCVQYPGRQDRRHEPPIADLGELADQVVHALGSLDSTLPLALFGHSLGATLGFEIAHRLERDKWGPVVLFCSGQVAPSIERDGRVHLLDDPDLLDEIHSLSGTDLRALGDEELVRMVLPAVRCDYRAIETYRWAGGPPIGCPIVSLSGDADPWVSLTEADAWRSHTLASFTLRTFSGGHFFLSAHWPAIAEIVGATLRPAS